MMGSGEIVRRILENQSGWRPYGVRSLSLFGSVARGEEREGSDVDILVEFNGPVSFDRYMGLKFFLEDLLGMPVDLATPAALKPRIRAAVRREAVRVA